MATPKPGPDRGERFVANYKYLNNHKQEVEGVLGYYSTEAAAQADVKKWSAHKNITGFRILDREPPNEEEDIGTETD